MKTIILKSLLSRKKNYLVVMICGIFQVSVTFLVLALGDYLSLIVNGRLSDFLDGTVTVVSFMLTYELLFFLMVLVCISYIRRRVGDYAMLESLGLKKKHKYIFIVSEFGGIFVVSMIVGILIGIITSEFLKFGLLKFFSDTVSDLYYGSYVWIMTIVILIITYITIFIFFDETIACLGLDALMSFGKRNSRFYKKRILASVAGPVLILISFLNMGLYWGKAVESVPLSIALPGLLLIMVSMTGNCFEKLKSNARLYYKKIILLDQWYQQFYYYINVAFIISAFLFINIFLFSISLLDNLPVKTPENFPYDLVWMANEEDRKFLDGLKEEYNVEIEEYPCFRVATGDYAEQMAISVSTYEQWTRKRLNLKEKEIFVIYQRDRADRNNLGIDYNTKTPDIYIGKAKADLWLYIQGQIVPGNQFRHDFKVKGYEDKVLTGILSTSEQENIIVFSDSFYNKERENAEGANLIVLMQIADDYDTVAKKIYSYAQEHSQLNFFSLEDKNLIYEKRELLKEDVRKKLFGVFSNGLNMLILFICMLFVFSLKAENDFVDLEQKYKLYYQLGMSSHKRKSGIQKEIMIPGILSLFFGLGVSAIYIIEKILLKRMSFFWNIRYAFGIFLLFIGIILIFVGVVALYAHFYFRRIERNVKNE